MHRLSFYFGVALFCGLFSLLMGCEKIRSLSSNPPIPTSTNAPSVNQVKSRNLDKLPSNNVFPFGLSTSDALDLPSDYPRTGHSRFVIYLSDFKQQSSNDVFKKLDARLLKVMPYSREMTLTIVSNYSADNQERYVLPTAKNWKVYQNLVRKIVSRYSGNNNFGCSKFESQCPPNSVMKEVILARPVYRWQIENEWLHEIKNSRGTKPCWHLDKQVACVSDLVKHFKKMKETILSIQPESHFVLGAFSSTLLNVVYLKRGLSRPYHFVSDSDCDLRKVSGVGPEKIKQLENRYLDVLSKLTNEVDEIDFHFYDVFPNNLVPAILWLQSQKEKYATKKIDTVILESGSPLSFIPHTGAPLPPASLCREDHEVLYGEPYYEARLHAEHLVKLLTIGSALGLKTHLYTGIPTRDKDHLNFKRIALKNHSRTREISSKRLYPVFNSFELLSKTLSGYQKATKLTLGVYRFDYSDKKPIFVLWKESGAKVNKKQLSRYLGNQKYTLTQALNYSQSPSSWKKLTISELVDKINGSTVPYFVKSN